MRKFSTLSVARMVEPRHIARYSQTTRLDLAVCGSVWKPCIQSTGLKLLRTSEQIACTLSDADGLFAVIPVANLLELAVTAAAAVKRPIRSYKLLICLHEVRGYRRSIRLSRGEGTLVNLAQKERVPEERLSDMSRAPCRRIN
jgi:hypothetical protein